MARLFPLSRPASRAEIERLLQSFFPRESLRTKAMVDHWWRAELEFREAFYSCQWEAATRCRAITEVLPGGYHGPDGRVPR